MCVPAICRVVTSQKCNKEEQAKCPTAPGSKGGRLFGCCTGKQPPFGEPPSRGRPRKNSSAGEKRRCTCVPLLYAAGRDSSHLEGDDRGLARLVANAMTTKRKNKNRCFTFGSSCAIETAHNGSTCVGPNL